VSSASSKRRSLEEFKINPACTCQITDMPDRSWEREPLLPTSYHPLTMSPWACHLPSLDLSFLIFELRSVIDDHSSLITLENNVIFWSQFGKNYSAMFNLLILNKGNNYNFSTHWILSVHQSLCQVLAYVVAFEI
jgi:hypothetical protein